MSTITSQIASAKRHPILVGVASVFTILVIGMGVAFATGAASPLVAYAIDVLPPCCTVPPVTPPVLPPVVVPVIPDILPPCCTVPPVTPPVLPPVLPPVIPPVLPPVIPPVAPPPVVPQCTLSASPSTVGAGGSSTLTWTTTNATTGSIDHGVGSVSPVSGGTVAVTVPSTTTYTLTVTGPGGQVNCDTTVTVPPPQPNAPVCTLVAAPTTIASGGASTLTWTTTNAATFSIDNNINAVTPVPAGTRSVSPTQTTTYTGTATSASGQVAHCAATVTVTNTPPAPICTLVANPTAIQTGGTSSLSWTTTNATEFSIDQGINAVTPVPAGTRSVSPTQTTTYTGTAKSATGATVNCSATVTVTSTPPAPQCVLTASPTSITKGNATTITWSGTNIVSVLLDNGIGDKGPTGSVQVTPTSDTTYTGTFTTTTGSKLTCTAAVTVTTGGGGCTSGCGGGGGGSPKPHVVLSALKTPVDQSLVYLSQIPYTGLDLGPWGTAMYWIMLVLWSLALAYLVLFNAMPLAYRKMGIFGTNVRDVLKQEPVPVVVEAHAPAHAPVQSNHAHAPSHTPAHEKHAPVGYQSHEGFRSFAEGAVLTIDDIVKGLAREAAINPNASAHELSPTFAAAAPEFVTEHVAELHEELPTPRPMAAASQQMPINEDVRSFIDALLAGDRDAVFGTIRGITRQGGDSEAFLTHTVCALDDAYRARVDGSACHPDILAATADCHPSFLERIVTALTTAVDGSYSTGVTGVKLALTRALAVVNG